MPDKPFLEKAPGCADIAVACGLLAAYFSLDAVMERLGTYWGISEFIAPFAVLLALQIAAIWLLSGAGIKRSTSLCLTLFTFFFLFQYGHLIDQGWGLKKAVAAIAGIMLAGIVILARAPRLREIFRSALLLYMAIFLSLNVVKASVYLTHSMYDLSAIPAKASLLDQARVDPATAPDIYFIVQDAYASADTLQRLFGIDNAPFIRYLRDKGFYVAENSHSSYSQTMLSIASTLNLDYIQNDIVLPHTDFSDRRPAIDHFMRPRLVEFLMANGYDIRMASTGYDLDIDPVRQEHDIRARDFDLSAADVLINRTPVYGFLDIVFGRDRTFLNPHRAHYRNVSAEYAFLTQNAARDETDRPRFVYAHILLPHPPFVFDSKGGFSVSGNLDEFSYKDGAYNGHSHLYEGGWNDYYRQGYARQVAAANHFLSGFIDTALAQPSVRPKIIIIQGDHGSRLKKNFDSLEKSDPAEIFGIINAVYYSDGNYEGFRPDTSPVNAFRITVNRSFGTSLPLLENHSWFSPWRRPYKFTEVERSP